MINSRMVFLNMEKLRVMDQIAEVLNSDAIV
jgi:hypothetical protein